MRRHSRGIVALLAAGLVTAVTLVALPAQAASESLFGSTVPATKADTDTVPVTLGTKVTAKVAGKVTGVRFYKASTNTGTHVGAVYASDGSLSIKGNFTSESASGWQTWTPATALNVAAGTQFVVAVYMPKGRYASQGNYPWPAQTASLTGTGGAYSYGTGIKFPITPGYQNASYFIDVNFTPDVVASPSPSSPTSSATPTDPPVSPTPQPSSPAPTVTPTDPPTDPTGSVLNLPRVPWAGGPAYWAQFPNAKKGGWDKDTFFPVIGWFANFSNDAEVQFDKSKGINTYAGMDPNTDFNLFKDNGVYWLGNDGSLKNLDNTSGNNPGVFLDDEADGYISPVSAAQKHLADVEATVGPNRFSYANFTQLVVGADMAQADQEKFVNGYTDMVSLDMYWYSIPACDDVPYRNGSYVVPVPQATCRTAHSYGLMTDSLKARDAADGKLQPTMVWVENFNGLGGSTKYRPDYITGDQLKGAAMSTIIHGAMGLAWFNQSLTPSQALDCQGSNMIRLAQVNPTACGGRIKANIDAMGDVNNLVKSLAPVINTQSYQWNFGAGTDTMLKVKDGYAYIFAMTDGTDGNRTFTLPTGISSGSVEVVGENRSLTVSGGTFADSFAKESTYHVYRVQL